MSLCPLCVYSYCLFNFQYYVQIFEKNEVTIIIFLGVTTEVATFESKSKAYGYVELIVIIS